MAALERSDLVRVISLYGANHSQWVHLLHLRFLRLNGVLFLGTFHLT